MGTHRARAQARPHAGAYARDTVQEHLDQSLAGRFGALRFGYHLLLENTSKKIMTTSSKTSIVLCSSCHVGHLREERTTYTQQHEGQLVIVPNVPSLVCDYCGETSFHPIVLERLQQLLWAEGKPLGGGTHDPRPVHRPSV